MRKVFAIGLLGLYMLSIIHPDELLKIPTLIQHYRLHRLIDRHMTLWSFVCNHYAQGDFRDADYEEDMKLPFKIPQHCINNLVSYTQNLHTDYNTIYKEPMNTDLLIIRNISGGSALLYNTIWQPPKYSFGFYADISG